MLTELPRRRDLVFMTPSHQFPTTVTMPLERRLELLKLAAKRDFVIIEDDYEFETNYVNEPCPALKSLDDEGRVVYVGSLSKTLFPGPEAGFSGRSEELVAEARALRRLMVRHAPNNNQRTAALFLSLGHHDTLIRRLHRAYRSRWEIMGAALDRHLPDSTTIPSFGGTSFCDRGPEWLDSEALAEECLGQGILIEPGRIYFGGRSGRAIISGWVSHRSIEKIEPGIKLLAEVIGQGERRSSGIEQAVSANAAIERLNYASVGKKLFPRREARSHPFQADLIGNLGTEARHELFQDEEHERDRAVFCKCHCLFEERKSNFGNEGNSQIVGLIELLAPKKRR